MNLISFRAILAATVFGTSLIAADNISSCRAEFDGSRLTIANRHIERQWRLTNGLLYSTSFRDLDTGFEWVAGESQQPAPYPTVAVANAPRQTKFTVRKGKQGPVEAESLVAELTATGRATLTYRFQIFPETAGVSVRLTTTGNLEGDHETSAAGDALEDLDLTPLHLRLRQVRLFDQTDKHNELVQEDEWLLHPSERQLRLAGNLFVVEDYISGRGLVFLKEAPLPHARPVKSSFDFTYEPKGNRFRLMGEGTGAADGEGYRFVVLAYHGGRDGRIEALQTYQRSVRVYQPGRDGMLVSNTWGDRSRDSRINAAFMQREVEAGSRLGVDVIQIDDGWQQGRTRNSAQASNVWSGFWNANPKFWEPDPVRFPGGLDPVVKLAASKGMKFGLWFAPDSSRDFANWERDANRILELHQDSGIDYVKIDGVRAVTNTAEQNLHRFFDRVLQASKGGVTFDLDVTADIRPGYFGALNTGPIFVENRYTDWHNYWPHQALRNLWKLAQYVDPLRLRMEFLNNARNTERYANDSLAPARYSPAYLFATTMFANPLGWFEISNLPDNYFRELPGLIAAWKRERPRLFTSVIIPIGETPDGIAWTGFAAVAPDHSGGYLLIFRERSGEAGWKWRVPMFAAADYRTTVLGGNGSATVTSGELVVHIPQPYQFVWLKLEEGGH